MPERTTIEVFVRDLIASDVIYRPLKSLGEKGVRRLDSKARNIADLLKEREEVGERVHAKVERIKEEQKARTLKQGIEAFKRNHPKYGEILQGFIDETRMRQNRYLVYGLEGDFKLGEEDYLRVMMDLGFSRREASSIYPHIIAVSERLGKASEQDERKILVSKK